MKKRTLKKPLKAKAKPAKKESGNVLDKKQDGLFFYGAPPAIKALYKTNKGYDSKFHPVDFLLQLQEGKDPDQVAASWGISGGTLDSWVETHPEMSEARKVGATAYAAYWKYALRLSAFGQLRTVNEKSLFKILDNQVGFNDANGGHEFADTVGADVSFIDGDGKEIV